MSEPQIDSILVENIRRGQTQAWQDFIDRFEGRLLAYVGARLADRAHAEDIVQDTFIGFLNSLPNFDCSRPLESYLFSIASYKLTDHLRAAKGVGMQRSLSPRRTPAMRSNAFPPEVGKQAASFAPESKKIARRTCCAKPLMSKSASGSKRVISKSSSAWNCSSSWG